jgi:copper transport protein
MPQRLEDSHLQMVPQGGNRKTPGRRTPRPRLTAVHRLAGLRRLVAMAAAVLGLTALIGLVTAAPASAHAVLVGTQPADGAVLAAPPPAVTLTFGEPVETALASVRLYGASGRAARTGALTHPAGRADELRAALQAQLSDGTYSVRWHIVSADGHPETGGFTFSVRVAGRSTGVPATGGDRWVSLLYWLARLSAYLGLVLLVGVGAFVLVCWPASRADPWVARLLWGGWWALAAGTTGLLLLQGPYAEGVGLSHAASWSLFHDTLGTRLGRALAVRVTLLGASAELLSILLVGERLSARRRRHLGVTSAAVAVGLAATWAVSGHAGTGIQVPLAVPVDVVHLLAVSTWVGGLVALAVAALPRATPDELVQAVRTFSSVAAGSVLAIVLSGGYQLWRQLGSLPALVTTTYGRLLLVKLLGVGVILVLAAASRAVVRSQVAPVVHAAGPGVVEVEAERQRGSVTALRRIRRAVMLEAALGVAVLALTSILVQAEPARAARAEHSACCFFR